MRKENLKYKSFQNLIKIAKNFEKIAKTCNINMLKTIPLQLETK